MTQNFSSIGVLVFFALVLFFSACKTSEPTPDFDVLSYVNPNIGSVHGRWFFYTPAALPFGMAKLAPHTNAHGSPGSWMPNGYDDRHTSIEGFGHFHEFQIGGVVVMPTVGKLQTSPGSLDNPDSGYRSRFDKEAEYAEPGYYSVSLKDYGVKVELTATERVGFHRYTFPEADSAYLIFDLGHPQGESGDVTEAWGRWNGDREIEGSVTTYPEYVKFCDPGNRVKMYFIARLNKKPNGVGAFVDSLQMPNKAETKGIGNGLFLNFSTKAGEQLEMQVGLSYTSIANARLNLEQESRDRTFDEVKTRANDLWNKKLSRIQVSGGKQEDKVKFYTGLYHALLGRGLASDVNGAYPVHDGTIGQIPLDANGKPTYQHFNSDGIWGGFWNLGQLWALAYPEYLSEYVQSNIDFFKEVGWLHDGTAAGTYTNGVQTNFQALLMAAAYNCGIRDFDLETGYRAALKNEIEYRERDFGSGKYDLESFVKLGYIPYRDTTLSNGWVFNFGTSHLLEYAFSSYAVAQLARDLGTETDYQKLMQQAGYWKNVFDPETKFMRPRLRNGNFIDPYDPMIAWKGFQEGNGFQYTWYVPHDVAGLIELVGKDLFNERLEQMFEDARKSVFGGGKEIDSFSGIEKLYNHGNQPCLHNAWLFNYSGKPWLSQQWVRNICNEFYGTTGLHGYGFGQDEDQGQLGAWYVMASMGLFDVQGHAAAQPTFQLGSPLFDQIVIQLNPDYYEGEKLVIKTHQNTPENFYIQSASWNDETISDCWINRAKLMKGGTLEFEMGAKANKDWGRKPPPSMSGE